LAREPRRLLGVVADFGAAIRGHDRGGDDHADKSQNNQKVMHGISPRAASPQRNHRRIAENLQYNE
jgi:hypothetical protein